MAKKPVYPRWRGEHGRSLWAYGKTIGLSPLARGTREKSLGLRQDNWFIPAGAGNTFVTASMSGQTAVYPRWRGEHLIDSYLFEYSTGLSPLARGTRRFRCDRSR